MIQTTTGLKFAQNERELVGSLFKQGGTAHGTYKPHDGGALMFDGKGSLRAFIVPPRAGSNAFIVTASMDGKRPRFMFGLSSPDAQWLGLGPQSRMSDECREAMHILKQINKPNEGAMT